MIAIPTEALNEKANLTIVIANNKNFFVGLESLLSFYLEQKQEISKLE